MRAEVACCKGPAREACVVLYCFPMSNSSALPNWIKVLSSCTDRIESRSCCNRRLIGLDNQLVKK